MICEECAREFEGRAGAKFCSDRCRVKAHRAKGAEVATKLERVPDASLSEEEEQALRDHFGYSKTERRSKEERDEAARRMLERMRPDGHAVEVMDDISAQLLAQEAEHERKVARAIAALKPVPSP